jgi:hypothetical protein
VFFLNKTYILLTYSLLKKSQFLILP